MRHEQDPEKFDFMQFQYINVLSELYADDAQALSQKMEQLEDVGCPDDELNTLDIGVLIWVYLPMEFTIGFREWKKEQR